MTDTTPTPEAADTGAETTAEATSTRPTDAAGRNLAHWTTEALQDMLAEGTDELGSISIQAELAWRDAQKVDIATDAEALWLLLKPAGFEKHECEDHGPHLHHRTGITIEAYEEAFVIFYALPFKTNAYGRLEISRATTHQAVADAAQAFVTWREYALWMAKKLRALPFGTSPDTYRS